MMAQAARNLITRKNGTKWLPCIGLEIHCQILTNKKLFSRAGMPLPVPNNPPNCYVSLVDASIPGVYPQINKHAVKQAIKAALVLNCEINKKSYFERKHYFYHDMPQGYQITQQDQPIARNGKINIIVEKDDDDLSTTIDLAIDRIQLEQDSGKTVYDKTGANIGNTAIDLNRAGVGLLELVFAPQLTSPAQAVAALTKIQHLFKHLNICDGKIELGNMRCDVNISVAPYGENGVVELGERVEIKNLNGQQNIYNAIQYEIGRQISKLDKNEKIVKETRGYNDINKSTVHMRYKESQVDYRFFPDPDLKVLEISDVDIADIQLELESDWNNLPEVKSVQLQKNPFGLDKMQADYLVSRPMYYEYFLEMFEIHQNKQCVDGVRPHNANEVTPLLLYNWIVTDLHGILSNYYGDHNTMVNILSASHASKMKAIKADMNAEFNIEMLQKNIKDLLSNLPIPPAVLYEIVYLVVIKEELSNLQAKKLVNIVIEENLHSSANDVNDGVTANQSADMFVNPSTYVLKLAKKNNMLQISDIDRITQLCLDSINDEQNEVQLQRFINGTLKLQASKKNQASKSNPYDINPTWKYFFGDVMKKSNGNANPKLIEDILIPLLKLKL